MKKITALLLVFIFAVALMAGCGPKTPAETSASPSTPTSAEPSGAASGEPSAAAPGTVKTGLGIINSVAKSTDATADAEGLAEADSLIVAVTADSAGKIIDCVIDQAQSKVNFNTDGELTTPLDATFMTKDELGADYGMGKVSTIGKEWNEQAAAFAAYVIGKTGDEVAGIAVNEGYAAAEDLKASVTIHITDFIAGVQKAIANAADLGAMAGDTLSVATVTNIAKSKNAAADAEGLAQVYSTYVAITQDDAGTVTSCVFDASQSNVNFDTSGKITTDLSIAPQTKDELKEAYGLKAASGIGKEWYEQAASFAAYVTGKTIEEVQGIAVSEGYAADEDLKASVTIHITDFIDLIVKAAS